MQMPLTMGTFLSSPHEETSLDSRPKLDCDVLLFHHTHPVYLPHSPLTPTVIATAKSTIKLHPIQAPPNPLSVRLLEARSGTFTTKLLGLTPTVVGNEQGTVELDESLLQHVL